VEVSLFQKETIKLEIPYFIQNAGKMGGKAAMKESKGINSCEDSTYSPRMTSEKRTTIGAEERH